MAQVQPMVVAQPGMVMQQPGMMMQQPGMVQQPVGGVITSQPGGNPSEWTDDLFGCCNDPGICVYTWCCPYCAFGSVMQAGLDKSMCTECCIIWAIDAVTGLPHDRARRVPPAVRAAREAVLRLLHRVHLRPLLDVPDGASHQGAEPEQDELPRHVSGASSPSGGSLVVHSDDPTREGTAREASGIWGRSSARMMPIPCLHA